MLLLKRTLIPYDELESMSAIRDMAQKEDPDEARTVGEIRRGIKRFGGYYWADLADADVVDLWRLSEKESKGLQSSFSKFRFMPYRKLASTMAAMAQKAGLTPGEIVFYYRDPRSQSYYFWFVAAGVWMECFLKVARNQDLGIKTADINFQRAGNFTVEGGDAFKELTGAGAIPVMKVVAACVKLHMKYHPGAVYEFSGVKSSPDEQEKGGDSKRNRFYVRIFEQFAQKLGLNLYRYRTVVKESVGTYTYTYVFLRGRINLDHDRAKSVNMEKV